MTFPEFVCPACRAPFAAGAGANVWQCTRCDRRYEAAGGAPVLFPDRDAEDATQRAFARQWELQAEGAYEADTIYGETPEQELQSFLERFGIRDPQDLAGRRVLDIGCGSGRLTQNLARWAPQAIVVGGDRSDSAHLAFRRCNGTPNVRIAQFDLHHAPFLDGTFDFIYADGVIPHVPDPEAALGALDRLLRPGGRMFAWIYPRTFSPYRALRDVLVRPSALPLGVQRAIEWTVGLPLWAAFKMWEPLRGPRRRSLREVVFMLHDNLAPEFQHRRSEAQLSDCLRRLGYTDVRAVGPPTGLVGTKANAQAGGR